MRSALIIGGSAGLGRALAEELASQGWALFLVATDARDLGPLACDLSLRFDADVRWRPWDIATDAAADLVDAVLTWRQIDAAFLISGFGIPDADDGTLEAEALRHLVAVNFTGPAAFLTQLLSRLRERDIDVIVAGSVATARPRPRNLVYGASKRALRFFCEGLSYRAAGACRLQFYQLGYLDTALMADYPAPLPKADPRKTARAILGNMGRNGTFFLPRWWRFVLFMFSLLPGRFIANGVKRVD